MSITTNLVMYDNLKTVLDYKMFISKNKPVPVVKDDPTFLNQPNRDYYNTAMRQHQVADSSMPDKPLPDHELITPYALDIHTINRRLFQPKPDPATPVAATVEPLFMVEEHTTPHTYHCQMPHQMFHKLFNQQDLPNGFSIEHVYGHDLVLVTYDPTDDIPRHPDCEVTE